MTNDFFETALLDDNGKLQLCLDLLTEFGAQNVRRPTGRGEIIHSCCLPFGAHKNGDRSPSASLNYKKLTYNCLGCGSSGGLLWFIAVSRGGDGVAARQWLEKETGLGGNPLDFSRIEEMIKEIYSRKSLAPPPIPTYAESVLDQWDFIHPYMTTGAPELGVEGRGIPEATLDHFRIGYAQEFFMGEHQPTQERIIIPHFWRGKLVGWQARRINDADTPKYKSSYQFPKDLTLYNYEPLNDVVVVESPASVLRHWHHVPTMTATFGAKITEQQIRLLQRARSVICFMDPDEAGWTATELLRAQVPRHASLKIVDNPYDADPADLADDIVDTLISSALPWGAWRQPTALQEVS